MMRLLGERCASLLTMVREPATRVGAATRVTRTLPVRRLGVCAICASGLAMGVTVSTTVASSERTVFIICLSSVKWELGGQFFAWTTEGAQVMFPYRKQI